MASISEAQRAKMFLSLSNSIGVEEAETMSTALNLDGQLATRDELKTEILAVREDMRTDIDALRTELRTGLAEVRKDMASEFADVRKELADMRERFAAANRSLLFQLLAMQMSLFGLVIAGAKLLG
jgi:hypothetical protein